MWSVCESCTKREYCPIKFNVDLVNTNTEKVVDFITKHYTYQQEYGNRMTIRNVSAHLSYAITGGLECRKVRKSGSKNYLFEYLFSNNFFGYRGFSTNQKSLEIKAINETYKCNYEVNKIYADEKLFIDRDYSSLPVKLQNIVKNLETTCPNDIQFEYAIKRMYYLFNLETNPTLNERLTEELFSRYFTTWMNIKSGVEAPKRQSQLIFDVLNILFTGSMQSKRDVPVTMKRENGIVQDVQCMYGNIRKRDIDVKLEKSGLKGCETTLVYLYIDGNRVNYPLNLPLMDYFNDLIDGAVTTDVNPLLTQGIDSIKSQCIAYCETSTYEDTFSLKILHNDRELEFSREDNDFIVKVQ
jgi:hypothetical protein